MKHRPPHDFVAAPHRSSGRATEAELNRSLQQRFRPRERARTDAQRLDAHPSDPASDFTAEVDQSRAEHLALARMEALAAITANTDVVGLLSVTVPPSEIDHRVEEAEAQLERVYTERRKEAEKAKATWRQGLANFHAWADRSGARVRMAPWPTIAAFVFVIAFFTTAETFVGSLVLAGPPIEGVPSPLLLGLIFAVGSLIVGALAAVGHMLAADARSHFRSGGWGLFALAFLLWAVIALAGAHMRASIEAGGSGTGPEIWASIHRGLLAPLVSPLAILLAGASAATAAAMWFKSVTFFGVPLGHRIKDGERRYCIDQLHHAEEAHKAEVKKTVCGTVCTLGTLETECWKPANDAARLEREVLIIVTQARESERAIDRAHAKLVVEYGNTFRRVRPAADIAAYLQLPPMETEVLGEPGTLRHQVRSLEEAGGHVSAAVHRGKVRLRAVEVEHLAKVDALYAETRSGWPGPASRAPLLVR